MKTTIARTFPHDLTGNLTVLNYLMMGEPNAFKAKATSYKANVL